MPIANGRTRRAARPDSAGRVSHQAGVAPRQCLPPVIAILGLLPPRPVETGRARPLAAGRCLLASLSSRGQDGGAMGITELPSTPLVLSTAGELVHIRTQR